MLVVVISLVMLEVFPFLVLETMALIQHLPWGLIGFGYFSTVYWNWVMVKLWVLFWLRLSLGWLFVAVPIQIYHH